MNSDKVFAFFLGCVLSGVIWLGLTLPTYAVNLQERIADFPQWQQPPLVEVALGDLVYPSWFAGEWVMESTLIEQSAPLAPDLITPGFKQQAAYLNQPVRSQVRFIEPI